MCRREEHHDPGSVPERDPQHIAHDLTADLTQRLVVYATTVHTLNFSTPQGRVVGELLRQAEQLHDILLRCPELLGLEIH